MNYSYDLAGNPYEVLKGPSSLDDPDQDGDNCNYKKYVDHVSDTECEKSDGPCDDQHDGDDIK